MGRSGEEVRRKAANGDLADATARLDACGADAELIALTKACLAPEAIDRPKDAQAVADALTAYLDGVQERLQAAERERAVAEAREVEERKRRRVQLALAAAVLRADAGRRRARLVADRAGGAGARPTCVASSRTSSVPPPTTRGSPATPRRWPALLAQAEEALRAGDAAKAAVALEAARKRSAEGGAEKEAERLGAARGRPGPARATWTPSTSSAGPPSRTSFRTRRRWRRGPGTS